MNAPASRASFKAIAALRDHWRLRALAAEAKLGGAIEAVVDAPSDDSFEGLVAQKDYWRRRAQSAEARLTRRLAEERT